LGALAAKFVGEALRRRQIQLPLVDRAPRDGPRKPFLGERAQRRDVVQVGDAPGGDNRDRVFSQMPRVPSILALFSMPSRLMSVNMMAAKPPSPASSRRLATSLVLRSDNCPQPSVASFPFRESREIMICPGNSRQASATNCGVLTARVPRMA